MRKQGLCKLRVSVGDNIIHSWFVRRQHFAHDMRGCCFCLCGGCESECADPWHNQSSTGDWLQLQDAISSTLSADCWLLSIESHTTSNIPSLEPMAALESYDVVSVCVFENVNYSNLIVSHTDYRLKQHRYWGFASNLTFWAVVWGKLANLHPSL